MKSKGYLNTRLILKVAIAVAFITLIVLFKLILNYFKGPVSSNTLKKSRGIISKQIFTRNNPVSSSAVIRYKVPPMPKLQSAQKNHHNKAMLSVQKNELFSPINRVTASGKNNSKNVHQTVEQTKTNSVKFSKPNDCILKPSQKKMYSVQVGAFLLKKNAELLSQKLREKGYKTCIVQVSDSLKRTWNKLLVGVYADLDDAISFAHKFKTKEKMPAIVTYFDSLNPIKIKSLNKP